MKLSHFKLISAALFLVACLMPVGLQGDFLGWHALIFGWIGVVVGDLAWLANFTIIGTWCAKTSKTLSLWFSLTAALALWHVIFVLCMSRSDAVSLIGGPGSYFWFASIGIMGWALMTVNIPTRTAKKLEDDDAVLLEHSDAPRAQH